MKINQGITFALLIWNLLIFVIYGIDKSKAKREDGDIAARIEKNVKQYLASRK